MAWETGPIQHSTAMRLFLSCCIPSTTEWSFKRALSSSSFSFAALAYQSFTPYTELRSTELNAMKERQFSFLHHYEQMGSTKSVLIYVAVIKKSL
jgi:hypothetical protein